MAKGKTAASQGDGETGTVTSLYDEICTALGVTKEQDESNEDFKGRAVEAFSDTDDWPDEKYYALPERLQEWIHSATEEYKRNRDRKRPRKLPPVPGLDSAARSGGGRPDINAPVEKRGRGAGRQRKREVGSDCVTRVMKELVNTPDASAKDLQGTLNQKYEKEYSEAAIRYAIQAFRTAKQVLADAA